MALFAQFTFNTADGTDTSGNGHTATVHNSPTFPAGVTEACISLNGTTQFAVTAALQGPQSAMTLMAWVKPTSVTSSQIILSQYESTTAYCQLFITSSGVLHGRIQQAHDTIYIGRITNSGALAAGVWQQVAMVWNGGTTNAAIAVYINGVQVDTTDEGAGSFSAPYSGTVPFTIGAQDGGSGTANAPFGGRIDEINYFDTALTQAQIQALYAPTLKKAARLVRQFKRRLKFLPFRAKSPITTPAAAPVRTGWMWSSGPFSSGPLSSAGEVITYPPKAYPRAWPRLRTRKRWPWNFRPKHFYPAAPAVILKVPLKRYLTIKAKYRKRWNWQFRPKHIVFPPAKPYGSVLKRYPLIRAKTRKRWNWNFRPKHLLFKPAVVALILFGKRYPVVRAKYRKRWAWQFRPKHIIFPPVKPFAGSLKRYKLILPKRRKFVGPSNPMFRPRHLIEVILFKLGLGSYKLLRVKRRKVWQPRKVRMTWTQGNAKTSFIWSAGPFASGPFSSAGRVIGLSYGGAGLRIRPLIKPKRRKFVNLLKKIRWYPINPPAPPAPVTATWIWSAAPWSSGPYSSAGHIPAPPLPPPPPPGPPVVPAKTIWIWSSGPFSGGSWSSAGQVTNPPPKPIPQGAQQLISGVTLGPVRVTQPVLQRLRGKATSLLQARSVSSALQVLRGSPPTLED